MGDVIFFLMIQRPPRSTQSSSSAASDVYKRQDRYRRSAFAGHFEHHHAVAEREKRMVRADADVAARVNLGAALGNLFRPNWGI